jgi:hypothetical protein
MSERVKLAPHPAKNKHGDPLFPELRSIIADGYGLVGYTGDPPWHRVQFINWYASQEPWILTAVKSLVEAEFRVVPDSIDSVPEPIESATDEDDE